MKNIVLIGERCIDIYEYVEVTRINPEAPTPVMKKISQSISDGMTGNVHNNLLSLSDGHANILSFSPNTDIVKRRYVDKKSGYILFRLDENDYVQQAFNNQDLLDLNEYLSKNQDSVVVVSDYNKGYLSEVTLREISFICKSKGIKSFLDTKKILGGWSKEFFTVKINQKEYLNNYKVYGVNCKFYCQNLLVTDGENGITIMHQDAPQENFQTSKVEVRDVCGAGDVALAALAVKYLESESLNLCIHFANNAASFSVTKRGTYAVTRRDLNI